MAPNTPANDDHPQTVGAEPQARGVLMFRPEGKTVAGPMGETLTAGLLREIGNDSDRDDR